MIDLNYIGMYAYGTFKGYCQIDTEHPGPYLVSREDKIWLCEECWKRVKEHMSEDADA
jgi:hypothetical protein